MANMKASLSMSLTKYRKKVVPNKRVVAQIGSIIKRTTNIRLLHRSDSWNASSYNRLDAGSFIPEIDQNVKM